MSYPQHFSKHVVQGGDESKCWIWSGAKNSSGYGCIAVDGKTQLAHRIAYQSHYGDLQDDLLVRHKCDIKLCVNPAHLEQGTHQENTQDSIDRNRYAKTYEQNKRNAKLSKEDISTIKELHSSGMSQRDIAKIFKVHNSTICLIVNDKAWRN